jgi:hypothetical protein
MPRSRLRFRPSLRLGLGHQSELLWRLLSLGRYFRVGGESDDARFSGDQGEKCLDLETNRVWIFWIQRRRMPDDDNYPF